MSVEDILRTAIDQGQKVCAQALSETNRISDKMYRLLGDPDATVADLHKDDDEPDAEPEVTA